MCTICQSLKPAENDYKFHEPDTALTLDDMAQEYASITHADAGTVVGGKPVYSLDQIATYLTEGYWEDTGRTSRSFDVDPGGSLNVNLSGLSDSYQKYAKQALEAWTNVSGIKFNDISDAQAAPFVPTAVRQEDGNAAGNRDTTATMATGERFKGSIQAVGDNDWIAVKLEAGKHYSISLNGDGTSGQIADTVLALADAQGTRLAQNDDRAAVDRYSTIEVDIAKTGTYYIQAKGYGTSTGSYQVDVEEGQTTSSHINFTDKSSGAFSTSYVRNGVIQSSSVNVGEDWAKYGNDYLRQTFIHEIGHALGLGHSGNYNGSASFGENALFANDSWQTTVMSYFSQRENPNVDASYLRVVTPQMADIVAIQKLYGVADTLRTGNTTYGDNHQAGIGMRLSGTLAATIIDNGGTDTIDLSSRSSSQMVNLAPGTFSDIDGKKGNVGIQRGTIIENAKTGSGQDTIKGNHVANTLDGGANNDLLYGQGGNDILIGNRGSDKIYGGAGEDTAVFSGKSGDHNVLYDAAASNDGVLRIKNAAGDIDTLYGVEKMSFDDKIIDVQDLLNTLKQTYGPIEQGSGKVYTAELNGEQQSNTAPTATNDTATTSKDAAVSIDVLANDTDANGDSLKVVSVNTDGLKGTATVKADGTIQYQAGDSFDTLYNGQTAQEKFSYTISDGRGGTSTANVTVTVKGSGEPPVVEDNVQMQVGRVQIQQSSGSYWQKVTFADTIKDAVVVMGPASFNGADALAVRVRNVTDTGFEFQLDEWSYFDGKHMVETISWMAGSAGQNKLADGSVVTFGSTNINNTSGTKISLSGLDDAPIVMGQMTGDTEKRAVTHRVNDVSKSGFDVSLNLEEAKHKNDLSVGNSKFSWVALDLSDNSPLFQSGSMTGNHTAQTVGTRLNSNDAFFADMQTVNGPDTATLRYDTDANGNVSLIVHEETSRDSEVWHANENISWVNWDTGLYDLT